MPLVVAATDLFDRRAYSGDVKGILEDGDVKPSRRARSEFEVGQLLVPHQVRLPHNCEAAVAHTQQVAHDIACQKVNFKRKYGGSDRGETEAAEAMFFAAFDIQLHVI